MSITAVISRVDTIPFLFHVGMRETEIRKASIRYRRDKYQNLPKLSVTFDDSQHNPY